jgi:cytidylate kinase
VGLAVVRAGGDPEDEDAAIDAARALDLQTLDDPELLGDDAASAASKVAAIGEVRLALLEFQRNFAASPPDGKLGAILDGRDIGTVICPDALVKLFVTASVEIRAQRRHKELLNRGTPSIYPRVLDELKARDARDMNRATAPLVAAEDAVVLDTTELDVERSFAQALRLVGGPVREALDDADGA